MGSPAFQGQQATEPRRSVPRLAECQYCSLVFPDGQTFTRPMVGWRGASMRGKCTRTCTLAPGSDVGAGVWRLARSTGLGSGSGPLRGRRGEETVEKGERLGRSGCGRQSASAASCGGDDVDSSYCIELWRPPRNDQPRRCPCLQAKEGSRCCAAVAAALGL